MELREKIAAILREAIDWDESDLANPVRCELRAADMILAIPEIAEALEVARDLDMRLADAYEDGWKAGEEALD